MNKIIVTSQSVSETMTVEIDLYIIACVFHFNLF